MMNTGRPSKKTLRRRASRAVRRARQQGIPPERFRALRDAWTKVVAAVRDAWARIRAAVASIWRTIRPHLQPRPHRQLLHNGRKP